MDRLNFLKSTGLLLGAGLTLSATLCKDEKSLSENLTLDSWKDVRNQFDLDQSKVHMAMMLLASHPTPVKNAIEYHRKQFDANPTEYWEHNFQTAEPKVLEAAANYLNVKPDEIALTDSTTQGLGTLYTGFKLQPGDEILTTTHDHYSTEKSLEFASQKNGASISRISLYDQPAEASISEIVGRLQAAINPNTRLIAITYVHSSTGVKLPIRAIADMIKKVNERRDPSERIYFSVDGVHGLGIEDITMEELGCDFFIAGTHKWMFGPRGTGIIWAKEDAWDMVVPTIPAFSYNAYGMYLEMIPEGPLSFSDLCTPGGYHAFDHRWSLNEAFDLHLQIGKDKIEERTHQLSSMLKEGLQQMNHVNLHTPLNPELSAGINCFEVDGMTPGEVVADLADHNIIASTSPYVTSYARLTPCIINTEEEVQTCLSVIGEMA